MMICGFLVKGQHKQYSFFLFFLFFMKSINNIINGRKTTIYITNMEHIDVICIEINKQAPNGDESDALTCLLES